MVTDPAVANALTAIAAMGDHLKTRWAVVGGHALQSHGVARYTLDLDAFVPPALLEEAAEILVSDHDFAPLDYDSSAKAYIESTEIVVLIKENDPVLLDIGEAREMIALRAPGDLLVELIAAQHPVEVEMINLALARTHHGVLIPVAPLGGVLLVKMKAHRVKDLGAIEQTAEWLNNATLTDAVKWAAERDPGVAEELHIAIKVVQTRRNPTRRRVVSRGGNP